jgi:N6-L-threonylcarbamoyladenine synthase
MRAVREFGARSVLLCGGVAANQVLRQALEKSSQLEDAQFFAPPNQYNTDNAAMIAVAAFMRTLRRRKKLPIVANGQLSI